MLDVPFGAQGFNQKVRVPKPGKDFMTVWEEWRSIQRGCMPSETLEFAGDKLITDGRALGQYVHIDVLFQAYFNACLILLAGSDQPTPVLVSGMPGGPGLGLLFQYADEGNPYKTSANQEGFGTLGGPYYITTLCEAATRALKAVWFQKWNVHRRLRPEAYGGRVHRTKLEAANPGSGATYPVHTQVLDSDAVNVIKDGAQDSGGNDLYKGTGAYLLPQAFTEGSPTHPAYGAGHATVAGACVTILKALFDEAFEIKNPKQAKADGSGLEDYVAPAGEAKLTLGGELNKLASNVATGRNIGGVHWRTDGARSLELGEQIAISILSDHKLMFNETVDWHLTRLTGSKW
ncbi:MAG: vanadium-dependent haloperoxidase [Verrucomicrobiota bacterium]|nr:vanadium-dependent haloperoxidase [Verrucomicrobiota bacterium]